MICGGWRGRFFAPFTEICGNIAEAHSSRFRAFLSGERKVRKRSAFSAPRAFRRGDAFRKAADGFRHIGERFVRDNASLCSRRYRAGANRVRDTALRRPIEGRRLGRLNCARMAVTLLGVTAFCLRHYGFRRIGERLVRYEGKSQRTRRYRAGANGVRGAALRRPREGLRLGRLNCSRKGGFPLDLR